MYFAWRARTRFVCEGDDHLLSTPPEVLVEQAEKASVALSLRQRQELETAGFIERHPPPEQWINFMELLVQRVQVG